MALTQEEKIEKFMEGAKTAAISPALVGPEVFKKLAIQYGWVNWNHYATVAALGSIFVKKRIEFKETGKYKLIKIYETAIKKWNKNALDQIDEFMQL
jgi:hypothetical protein